MFQLLSPKVQDGRTSPLFVGKFYYTNIMLCLKCSFFFLCRYTVYKRIHCFDTLDIVWSLFDLIMTIYDINTVLVNDLFYNKWRVVLLVLIRTSRKILLLLLLKTSFANVTTYKRLEYFFATCNWEFQSFAAVVCMGKLEQFDFHPPFRHESKMHVLTVRSLLKCTRDRAYRRYY